MVIQKFLPEENRRPGSTIPSRKKGFTLIEILVSISIFSAVIVIVSTSFVSAVKMQRRFLASTETLNEISFLMEYMTRSIRMAYKDTTGACLTAAYMNFEKTRGGQGLKLMNSKGRCQEFYLENQTLKQSLNNGAEVAALTSPKVKVSAFNIGPTDSWDQDDNDQPRVTIFMEIQSVVDNSKIRIQTTVSQRNPDIRL
jgi:prepilin-type N-terminal cleavage/methylation domain-containing protein